MGKRSIKTTKSGKFMNPTDQWRKESRRRELKKNKKQRTAVREAVLRAKDHTRMLREIEEIEKIEMDSGPVPLPNEKSLKEKKRKLEETLTGVVKYLEKEDLKRASVVKGAILDSESRRRSMARVFRDYQTARSQIDVADIPLPGDGSDALSDIPMPGSSDVQPGGPSSSGAMVPPPPPPGPPPADLYAPFKLLQDYQDEDNLSESEEGSDDEEDDGEDEEEEEEEEKMGDESRSRSVRFADDEQSGSKFPAVPPGPPPGLPPGLPPGPPPGVPPLMRPPPPPDGLPPRPPFGGPPGPPPGAPPGLPPHMMPPVMGMPPLRDPWTAGPPRTKPSPAIISAGPTVSAQPVRSMPEAVSQQPAPSTGQEEPATISATPKLRNMKAEVTKFMPTSLRVRRDNPKSVKAKMKGTASLSGTVTSKPDTQAPPANKSMAQGDAYDAFMKEMSGLL